MSSLPQLKALAIQYHQKGNYKQAEHIYKEILIINTDDVDVLYLYGLLLSQTNRYTLAIPLLLKAVEENPVNKEVLKNIYTAMIDAYIKLNLFNEAIIICHKLLEIEQNAEYNCIIAELFEQINDIDNAFVHYKQCIAIESEHEVANINIAKLYLKIQKQDEALKYFQKANSINSNNFEVCYNLGLINYNLKNYNKAISYFEKSVLINNSSAEAFSWLANAYYCVNQVDLAFQAAQIALKLDKKIAEYIIINNNLRYKLFLKNQQDKFINLKCDVGEYKFAIIYFWDGEFDEIEYSKFVAIFNQYDKDKYKIISANCLNSNIIQQLQDEFTHICFVEQGDKVLQSSLSVFSDYISQTSAEIFYTDEDIYDNKSNYIEPYFKTEFAPLLLLSHNYMNAFLCLKINNNSIYHLENISALSQQSLYLLILNLANSVDLDKIKRIPEVLYHRSLNNYVSLQSTSNVDVVKTYLAADKNAETTQYKTSYNKVKFEFVDNIKVSIIIPFMNKIENLKNLINDIKNKTSYKNYEIIIVKKGNALVLDDISVKIVDVAQNFNTSDMYNQAIKISKGDYLVFLNNNTQIVNSDWLESLLRIASQKNIGVVSGKTLYHNDKVQHSGMVKSANNNIFYANRLLSVDDGGYKEFNCLMREYSILTGAFIMISKAKLQLLNNFDHKFGVKNNMIDLCLKAINEGYYNVFIPDSQIYYKESEFNDEFAEEISSKNYSQLVDKWAVFFSNNDKFYNPNFSEYSCFQPSI